MCRIVTGAAIKNCDTQNLCGLGSLRWYVRPLHLLAQTPRDADSCKELHHRALFSAFPHLIETNFRQEMLEISFTKLFALLLVGLQLRASNAFLFNKNGRMINSKLMMGGGRSLAEKDMTNRQLFHQLREKMIDASKRPGWINSSKEIKVLINPPIFPVIFIDIANILGSRALSEVQQRWNANW